MILAALIRKREAEKAATAISAISAISATQSGRGAGTVARIATVAIANLAEAKTDDDGWSATDWQAYFDERVAVAEFDGALPRQQAETQAYRCCVFEWLCRNPVTSGAGALRLVPEG